MQLYHSRTAEAYRPNINTFTKKKHTTSRYLRQEHSRNIFDRHYADTYKCMLQQMPRKLLLTTPDAGDVAALESMAHDPNGQGGGGEGYQNTVRRAGSLYCGVSRPPCSAGIARVNHPCFSCSASPEPQFGRISKCRRRTMHERPPRTAPNHDVSKQTGKCDS